MELRHILAGADESGAGRDAVGCALSLATRASARVTVLRAIMTSAVPTRTRALAGAGSSAEDAASREIDQLQRWLAPDLLMRNELPPMDVEILEKPYSRGPFGAKGLGELPMDVPGPAVAAAIFHATGSWIPELPILPEKILRAYLNDQTKHQRQKENLPGPVV